MDASGTLSFDEFRAAARFLVDKWATVINPDHPPWTWIPHSDVATAAASSHDDKAENLSCRGYLALDNICTFQTSQDQRVNIAEEECCFTDSDAASLVQQHDLTLHYYDLHIVYSDSFRVPVLYFRVYTNDGSPLCMDDIERVLPPIYAKQLSDSKWTFITHEEHPYLNRPWYKLHPCGTGEWMKLLYDTDASLIDRNRIGTELYLLLWLSVVGPMIGFKIPIEARKQLIDEAFWHSTLKASDHEKVVRVFFLWKSSNMRTTTAKRQSNKHDRNKLRPQTGKKTVSLDDSWGSFQLPRDCIVQSPRPFLLSRTFAQAVGK